jgi:hypothetical protein
MNIGGILYLDNDTEIKVMDISSGIMQAAPMKEFLQ